MTRLIPPKVAALVLCCVAGCTSVNSVSNAPDSPSQSTGQEAAPSKEAETTPAQSGASGVASSTPAPSTSTVQQEIDHVVLLMTDDQGYGQAGYLGHKDLKTPNLDAMAAAGSVFENFYVQAPICSPTRVSLLTAKHPYTQNCFAVKSCSLPTNTTTIADRFKDLGFKTAHFGKWHIGTLAPRDGSAAVTPDAIGFDEYFSAQRPFDIGVTRFYTNDGMKRVNVEQDTSLFLVDKAIDFITRNHAAGQKTFTIVWYPSPHTPYISAPEFADSTADIDQLYGELKGVDASVGQLRSALDRLGVKDTSLLLFNSDNGAARSSKNPDSDANGGLRGGKDALYQGGIKVPAIIEYPTSFSSALAKKITVPFSTADVLPTLMAMVGGDQLDGQHFGKNKLPLMREGIDQAAKSEESELFFWYDRTVTAQADIERADAALIRWPYKILQTGNGAVEVFHLADDPTESRNVVASVDQEMLEALKSALAARKQAVTTLVQQ